MGKKGQSAFEFLLIISFMSLIFISLFALASEKLGETKEGRVMQTAGEIAGLIVSQVELAQTLSDGYSSEFIFPQTVEGSSYSITMIDGREVVVLFLGYEHVSFLAVNVTGNATFGENRIAKRNGRVYLNS
jgi:hypothetical protein